MESLLATLLACLDLGLSSTFDSESLAFNILAKLSGLELGPNNDSVLLKYIV